MLTSPSPKQHAAPLSGPRPLVQHRGTRPDIASWTPAPQLESPDLLPAPSGSCVAEPGSGPHTQLRVEAQSLKPQLDFLALRTALPPLAPLQPPSAPPPTAISPPPTAVGYPPTAVGPPPTAIGPSTNRHQPPTNRCRLPSNRRWPPFNRRWPPFNRRWPPFSRRWPPTNRHQPPTNRRPLPSNRRWPPSNRRTEFDGRQHFFVSCLSLTPARNY